MLSCGLPLQQVICIIQSKYSNQSNCKSARILEALITCKLKETLHNLYLWSDHHHSTDARAALIAIISFHSIYKQIKSCNLVDDCKAQTQIQIGQECLIDSWNIQLTSNFMLVVFLHFELGGSFRSRPAEIRDKFMPPLPEREKFSIGIPWTPISGERECWEGMGNKNYKFRNMLLCWTKNSIYRR